MSVILLIVSTLALCLFSNAARRQSEQERVQDWYAKGNTWPPNWQQHSEARKLSNAAREEELLMLPGANERWENFMQFTSSLLVPHFTEMGFELIQTPPEVQSLLKEELDEALEHWESIRTERQIDALYTPIPSKMINIGKISSRIQQLLQPIHEEWSGMKLVPTSIYGMRANRNGSSLVMHYDKIMTHVISSIVHVGHEYYDDNEPWPIEIEDHDGNLHAVNLEPGQMLLYESAACLHGRRSILKGEYYASVFNHYKPADKNIWDFSMDDIISSVPPHWKRGVIEDEGSRWAGQGLTIDSRVSDAAPPRIIHGEVVHDIREFYSSRAEL